MTTPVVLHNYHNHSAFYDTNTVVGTYYSIPVPDIKALMIPRYKTSIHNKGQYLTNINSLNYCQSHEPVPFLFKEIFIMHTFYSLLFMRSFLCALTYALFVMRCLKCAIFYALFSTRSFLCALLYIHALFSMR